MRTRAALAVALVGLIHVSTAAAQGPEAASGDWPWWRGPNLDGVAESGKPAPVKWSETTNVGWKTAVPGRGHSSPTVVGNAVFLSTADEQAQVQSIVCFDRKKGTQLWKRDVNQGGFPAKIH